MTATRPLEDDQPLGAVLSHRVILSYTTATWISFMRLVGRDRRSYAIKPPIPVGSGNGGIEVHLRRCVILLSFMFFSLP